MRITKICLLIFTLYFILSGLCFSAAEEEQDLPKIAFAKKDGSNVRAGDNINYEILCKLESGDPVKISGKRYSWYKIMLPKRAHLFIKNDYVDLAAGKGEGIVNAVRVNLRAGPGTKYSIMGRVSTPQKLSVISENDGWYEIEPPDGTEGWIHSNQIVFNLIDVKQKEEKNEVEKEVKVETPPIQTVAEKKGSVKLILTPRPSRQKGNLRINTQ